MNTERHSFFIMALLVASYSIDARIKITTNSYLKDWWESTAFQSNPGSVGNSIFIRNLIMN